MSLAPAENLIEIELPLEILSPIADTTDAFAKEMRVAAALFWYTQGRISADRAAEYAGLDRIGFIGAWAAVRRPAAPIEIDEDAEQGTGARASGGATAGTAVSDVPFSAEVAEAHYQAMGRIKGKRAAAPVQRAAREFWASSGEHGARWLARRLHWEFNVEALHVASAQLADLGETAIVPIVEELGGHPTPEQAEALLKALGWIAESPSAPTIEATGFELWLARFLQQGDGDVREGAALAMRLLPSARAAYWLDRRRPEEVDPYVRRAIDGEWTRHQAACG